MRVLIVTPWFPIASNPSSGVFVLRDAQALSGVHDVRVVHLDSVSGAEARAGSDIVDGVEVLRVPFARNNPAAWSTVREAVKSAGAKADVVHTHALPALLPFARVRPAGDTPWVHTEHWSGLTSPETLPPRGRIARRIMMPLLRRPDVVVSAAERLSRVIRSVRRGPIEYVPCVVVSPDAVVPSPRDTELLRLVGVGGIIPRKGPLVALRALTELESRGIRASLTWVGDGPQRAELEATATQLGLHDRLTLTGTLDDVGVGRELDANDLFILPTLGDNFCIVVAEALSHGRPVVSGAETGAVDYSDPRVSEFVEEHEPAAFAEAVERVWSRASAMTADDIADTVRGQFAPERVADLLSAVYRKAGVRD